MSWENTCHWCGEGSAGVMLGCLTCKHIFCTNCWHPVFGCPCCYAVALTMESQAGP